MLLGIGIPQERKDEVLQHLDIREILSYDKYLGLPTQIGRFNKNAFMFIKDRICKRLHGWLGKNILWASRELLVKAVALPIPPYAMSVFLLSNALVSDIQSSIINYWWGHDESKHKIHWITKQKLSNSKLMGGLGIRDLEAFNMTLLAK